MAINVTLEELLEAGAHFGHQVKRWNPKMSPFIYGKQDGVHVFDLVKTREALLAALEVLKDYKKQGKVVLFVGTKNQAREIVKKVAEEVGCPYVVERWLGGTLTNFEQIRRTVRRLQDLKKKVTGGEFENYTKKEKLGIAQDIDKMQRSFGGITSLEKLPDLLFIIDTHKENTAVREANYVGVKTMGIVDSNSDPEIITWPIPMNDDSNKSIELVMELVRQVLTVKSKGKSKK
ncbi:30S ribosomal protein S2 [Candidatus Woesebacteria bacterium RIFCSPHIGHO2_02_FULL_38_9]|uniref:Small ribosomal subunit protein uS2 n=1 Tax=Candidatus Woesebacteria bacterium RIFCSPHIGHO2_01_FULL_39_28 TaxID=1802496 RepID=A0A1F7YFM5_9BACT|nr:MAG: 30S ribosomal protein S2 [Candidatus Woesebacteria bacterium RIFCSPHIGHO2_01_FULL_39_28]OGM33644.1 MAG: 30S ribosomal protein S2 [Candidatus Woesebacteria bacterium RIFCSPHIGHO2_02_FULL_38_9]OGM58535.1 MAG: 30S ribosomal protein S2 [Candidatus Woesebacteria bacterium RIFCSPLOWO2_01_FULL_38_20]